MTIVRALAALLAAVAFTVPASAQTTLDLINEYPANSITGEADAFFADAVKRRSEGRIVVRPLSDAKSGVRTRDQLKAVTDGKFAMADSFAGGLDTRRQAQQVARHRRARALDRGAMLDQALDPAERGRPLP